MIPVKSETMQCEGGGFATLKVTRARQPLDHNFTGRVDDSPFFDYLSPFCFLLIEFYCSFSIFYKMLPDYVHYYCISIRM